MNHIHYCPTARYRSTSFRVKHKACSGKPGECVSSMVRAIRQTWGMGQGSCTHWPSRASQSFVYRELTGRVIIVIDNVIVCLSFTFHTSLNFFCLSPSPLLSPLGYVFFFSLSLSVLPVSTPSCFSPPSSLPRLSLCLKTPDLLSLSFALSFSIVLTWVLAWIRDHAYLTWVTQGHNASARCERYRGCRRGSVAFREAGRSFPATWNLEDSDSTASGC